jgi:phage-related minor tail protein
MIQTRNRRSAAVPATTDSAVGADSVWQASLKDLGHDLLNRQINLIVTTGGMVGNSAPPIRQALYQIATTYAQCLGMAQTEAIKALPDKPVSGELELYRNAFNTLTGDLHREEPPAEPADSSSTEAPAAADEDVSLRIADRTAVIANLLNGLQSSLDKLTPRQITTIQKIWEIGTDTIVMQTTISLGGDVVTRIHSDYKSSKNESIWQLHQQSVAASSSSWKDVVEAAVQLLQGLIGKL